MAAVALVDEDCIKQYSLDVAVACVDRNENCLIAKRLVRMAKQLEARGLDVAYLERVFGWSMLPRSPDGFLTENSQPLHFQPSQGQLYSAVAGVAINDKTKAVELLLEECPAEDTSGALFSKQDVTLIFSNFVSGASFSLDPLVHDSRVQPLQEATCSPGVLCNTDVGSTLLTSDYFLKMLTCGVEMSAKAPFRQRSVLAPGGALARLDDNTRFALRSVPQRTNEAKQLSEATPEQAAVDVAVSRKWIQCGDVQYEKELREDGTVLYMFRKVDLEVKVQVFRRRTDDDPPADPASADWIVRDGFVELTADDGHAETPDESFVRDFNANMDIICNLYPDMARLRELHRLMAGVKLAEVHLADLPSSSSESVQASPMLFPSTFVLLEDLKIDTPEVKEAMKHVNIPVSTVVDLQDTDFRFYTAECLEVDGDLRLFRYDGWSSEFDEWLPVDSPRIAAQNTYTPPGRSAGEGTGVYHAPRAGIAVQIQRPNAGPGATDPGVIVEADGKSVTARFIPPHHDRPVVTASVPVPYGKIELQKFFSTPSAEDIECGAERIRVGQFVDAADEYFNIYTAVVRKTDPASNTVFLQYHTWDQEWNAWAPLSRTWPLHTHTDRITRMVQTAQGIARVGVVPWPPPAGTEVDALKIQQGQTPSWEHALVKEVVNADGLPSAVSVRVAFDDGVEDTKVLLTCQVRAINPIMFNPATAEEIESGHIPIGRDVDAQDILYGFFTFTVMSSGPGWIAGKYHGWTSFHNERLSVPSARVQPLHTYTRRGFKATQNCPGVVVPPPEGTNVLVRFPDANDYQQAVVESLSASSLVVRLDGGRTAQIALPVQYGALQSLEPMCRAVDRIANSTYGGIKMQPVLVPCKTPETAAAIREVQGIFSASGGDRASEATSVSVLRANLFSRGHVQHNVFAHSALLVQTRDEQFHIFEYGQYGTKGAVKISQVSKDAVSSARAAATPCEASLPKNTLKLDDGRTYTMQKQSEEVSKVVTLPQMAEAVCTLPGNYNFFTRNCHVAQEYVREQMMGLTVQSKWPFHVYYLQEKAAASADSKSPSAPLVQTAAPVVPTAAASRATPCPFTFLKHQEGWHDPKKESLEGGTKTVGYGHKLSSQEAKDGIVFIGGSAVSVNDLTPVQGEILAQQDWGKHDQCTKTIFDNLPGNKAGDFEKLPPNIRQVLVDVQYNTGNIAKFSKLMEAAKNGDRMKMKSECKTSYTDAKGERHEMTRRNEARAKLLDQSV
eukprot:m.82391 g.82391  ORF g.82391 m.82391 type:complete len:1239 (-) comp17636_c0_seq1:262-3978(-)